MTTLNRHISLRSRPVGLPRIADFELTYSPLPSPGGGEVLVRSLCFALDPHLRSRMSAVGIGGPSLALGAVVEATAVGRVVQSEDAAFRVGDTVEGLFGWQEHALVAARDLRRLDPAPSPLSAALGVLGSPGLTAYFGLLDVGSPQRGETVVVADASRAIGMVAGQIARLAGCRVLGLVEGRGDISWLCDELGFDAAIGYENDFEVRARLAAHCPDGVDVYFDTTGGSATDEVMRCINFRARICTCGQASQDNLETPTPGPRWLDRVTARQATVQGFLVSSCDDRFPAGREALAAWLAAGELAWREDVAEGLEAAPRVFVDMLRGERQGHQLVQP